MKITKTVKVKNKAGFHLRVASMICKSVSDFKGNVFIIKGSYRADCKSCLDLLTIMAPIDTELLLEVDDDNEKNASDMIDKITNMFDTKFGEDEFEKNSVETI